MLPGPDDDEEREQNPSHFGGNETFSVPRQIWMSHECQKHDGADQSDQMLYYKVAQILPKVAQKYSQWFLFTLAQ